jgi:hypothetical protein
MRREGRKDWEPIRRRYFKESQRKQQCSPLEEAEVLLPLICTGFGESDTV